jgi:hypothetical protein
LLVEVSLSNRCESLTLHSLASNLLVRIDAIEKGNRTLTACVLDALRDHGGTVSRELKRLSNKRLAKYGVIVVIAFDAGEPEIVDRPSRL